VGATVHLLPQEVVFLVEGEVVLRLATLQHVAVGAGHARRKLGELPLRVGQPLQREVEIGARGRDLARRGAVFMLGVEGEVDGGGRAPGRPGRPDLRARDGLAHAGGPADLRSASSPVASRPQRVTSRTRSLAASRRRISTRTISWKKRAASRGLASMNSLTLTRSRARSWVSTSAWMVAVRFGSSPNTLISPKIAPGSSRLKICSTRPLTFFETRMAPVRMKNISSPGSPSRKSTSPLRSRRSRRRGQRAVSCSSSRSRRRSTWRRKAMSAGLATARLPPLHGPALHHDGLDGPEALGGGNLTFPPHGLEHQVVLIGGQRVVGQHCRGI